MKENIIVIGTVNEIEKYMDILEQFCHIVATLDYSNEDCCLEGYKAITFGEIIRSQYDKILLICENVFYEMIYSALTSKLKVDPAQIYGWEFLDEMKYQYDKERYESLYGKQSVKLGNFPFNEENEIKVLADYRADAGTIDLHYFFQDMIVASQIIKKKVSHHWDIGSRLDGFISHLLTAGIDTTVIDIRPFQEINIGCGVAKLDFIQADATDLRNIPDETIGSLSALHSIEHFGLGRYGDKVDPDAWKRTIHNMARILAVNGKLYLSVPVGQEEGLCFNAHRIFHPQTILKAAGRLSSEEMYLIHDGKVMFFGKEEIAEQCYLAYMGNYDCGIFIFAKDGSLN